MRVAARCSSPAGGAGGTLPRHGSRGHPVAVPAEKTGPAQGAGREGQSICARSVVQCMSPRVRVH
eukprot:3591570-Lingulodinium_polyedra.AAC.1